MEKNVISFSLVQLKRAYLKPNFKVENIQVEHGFAVGSIGTNQIIIQNNSIESLWEEDEIYGGIQL